MMKLLLVLLLLAPPPSITESNSKLRDRAQGPTPVTDKDLRPIKPPDCRNQAEVQRTLEQLSHGEAGDCFIRDKTAFRR